MPNLSRGNFKTKVLKSLLFFLIKLLPNCLRIYLCVFLCVAGLLYDHGHLARAVCCRVGRGDVDIDTQLPSNYRLNHPWLGRVTVCDPPREVQKTKALSVNWCFGDKGPEVTDGTQGLCLTR